MFFFRISVSTGQKTTFVLFVGFKGRAVSRLVPHHKNVKAQLKQQPLMQAGPWLAKQVVGKKRPLRSFSKSPKSGYAITKINMLLLQAIRNNLCLTAGIQGTRGLAEELALFFAPVHSQQQPTAVLPSACIYTCGDNENILTMCLETTRCCLLARMMPPLSPHSHHIPKNIPLHSVEQKD
jgi:hypothetical protein